ncbi:UDP-N-acetylenolpyruvoylglucosamine reductase [Candidatus Kaiserbacteria bacterium CG10_big_fil_rev_8_21_14_0_10_56_12]|uniref:UDP-N-acetylenolpyruvoylglucosamine reductase n=1 Tax=Candidatus Kaiserbacteria bacterium CG10_big_fil_rev_8_21_14_0_10_56_12 TaxID=1974611 RepID=A0A2H0U9R7_9BACT|nr:MAG: UDP-N-acetylenolpyruvoylglucosamine reductase [Candidatus Kaiserbacteria bacterium CG10_big_fil_rev_8_21_14_0_10_56_12]
MIVEENVALAPLTTFKIGGPARYFVEARTLDDVREALAFARERGLQIFVLGGGSNILIADEGFDGLVLRLRFEDVEFKTTDSETLATVGAGVDWDVFVARAVARGCVGVELLSGIPGTVGGAVAANLGAYCAECSDTFVQAEVIDTQDPASALQTFTARDCTFSYHDSFFSHHPYRHIILRALFRFASDSARPQAYHDSRFNFADLTQEKGRTPTLQEVREAVIKVRGEKGVLSTSYRSAGSFFHMPFVSRATYEEVQRRARVLDAEKEAQLRPWAWEQPDGTYKIAPGFLLEYTRFQKGYARGAVGISPKHTLSVITSDGATAQEVVALACAMHDEVEKLFSISLEREVKYIGIKSEAQECVQFF